MAGYIGEALQAPWQALRVQLIVYPLQDAALVIHHAKGSEGRWIRSKEVQPKPSRKPRRLPAIRSHVHQYALFLPYTCKGGRTEELVIHFSSQGAPFPKSKPFLTSLCQLVQTSRETQLLLARVARLSQRAHQEKQRLQNQLNTETQFPLVARSPVMRRVRAQIEMVAKHETCVFLSGEAGTEKTAIAKAIHKASRHSKMPMTTIHCSAIPEGFLEQALLAAETPALGLRQPAHSGSLLLENVSDLSTPEQELLLGYLRSPDQTTPRKRIIATSNRLLMPLVQQGRFLEDLYFQLCVFPISVPPLSERPEDFRPLVDALLKSISLRLKTPVPTYSEAALTQLKRAPWPGNLRELENTLEAACIRSKNGKIGLSELSLAPDRPPETSSPVIPLEQTIKMSIESALRRSGGKLYGPGGAAESLALNPGTLQSKMRKLSIQRSDFAAP